MENDVTLSHSYFIFALLDNWKIDLHFNILILTTLLWNAHDSPVNGTLCTSEGAHKVQMEWCSQLHFSQVLCFVTGIMKCEYLIMMILVVSYL